MSVIDVTSILNRALTLYCPAQISSRVAELFHLGTRDVGGSARPAHPNQDLRFVDFAFVPNGTSAAWTKNPWNLPRQSSIIHLLPTSQI